MVEGQACGGRAGEEEHKKVVAAQIPEVWRHCQLVADTLSVPVSWLLLAEISAAAFLAPTSPLPCKNRPLTHDALGLHPSFTPGNPNQRPDGLLFENSAANRTLGTRAKRKEQVV